MEYFYKFQRLNDEYKIVTKKNNNQTYINDTFIKFDNLKNKIKAIAVQKTPRAATDAIASTEGVLVGQLDMANGK